jgi:hypothetical protein
VRLSLRKGAWSVSTPQASAGNRGKWGTPHSLPVQEAGSLQRHPQPGRAWGIDEGYPACPGSPWERRRCGTRSATPTLFRITSRDTSCPATKDRLPLCPVLAGVGFHSTSDAVQQRPRASIGTIAGSDRQVSQSNESNLRNDNRRLKKRVWAARSDSAESLP